MNPRRNLATLAGKFSYNFTRCVFGRDNAALSGGGGLALQNDVNASLVVDDCRFEMGATNSYWLVAEVGCSLDCRVLTHFLRRLNSNTMLYSRKVRGGLARRATP